jgi:PAS domain-containing protein
MNEPTWIREFPGAITVCDAEGVIVGMNDAAARSFDAEGGYGLLGTNVLDCHPEPARKKLSDLLSTRQKNVYTIEKNGKKKLIYQSPWFINGAFAGIVELSLEIPSEMPHFVRT